MPIKIDKQGDDLYTADVTPPQGSWRSPHPMPNDELGRNLLSMGCEAVEIQNALQDAGFEPFSSGDREAAKIIRPLLIAALAGEREVPAQTPFTEAWSACALSVKEGARFLSEVIGSADALNDAVPNPDEISWAFLRLRRRGWLVIDGERFGLTPEGRRTVEEIVDRREPPWPDWSREEWMFHVKSGRPAIRRTRSVKKLEE